VYKILASACAAALALAAAPASAEVAAAAETTPPAKSAEDANKRICRTYQSTGWRTRPARVCRTRAEWAELAKDNEQEVRDLRRKRIGSQ
jgi:hypothetical protein